MNHTIPVDKQSALFLSRKRHTNTVQEAIDGAVQHLMKGSLQETLVHAFNGGFGPEPVVTYSITIRQDCASPGCFVYEARTKISHHIGEPVKLYGLKP